MGPAHEVKACHREVIFTLREREREREREIETEREYIYTEREK